MRKGFRFSTIYFDLRICDPLCTDRLPRVYSFNRGTMYQFEEFTLEWYQEVFQDTRLIVILLKHRGHCLAIGGHLHHHRGGGCPGHSQRPTERFRNALLTLNNVMIVSPDVIIEPRS